MPMPWKELSALDLKIEMINLWLNKEYTITELSTIYGVSRKTIYKWIERYNEQGILGLKELSRDTYSHPNSTPEEIVRVILDKKKHKMGWGPKKILARLRSEYPDIKWPADSTGNDILKRHGLVMPRKYRRHTPAYTEPFLDCNQSNKVWSADYKGQFRTGDGKLCYPLTITDNYSRYILGCRGLTRPTFDQTKPYFEWVFRQYGLPEAIRTDNGTPFAGSGFGGLSRLSVWFIKLGIKPERIEAGCPQQNGRHERMHRTLKQMTASPPRKNMTQQQIAFNRFTEEYNNERPHEALGQKPPASVYSHSTKQYPVKLPSIEYNDDDTIRYVHNNGCIKWNGGLYFLSKPLIGEYVLLKQLDEYLWEISYSSYPLGLLDVKKNKIIPY
jgi:transposase InsO family protein